MLRPKSGLWSSACTSFKTRGLSCQFLCMYARACMCESVRVWEWASVFRNRSSLAVICHFNEKRTGRIWRVDDKLWPNTDQSVTSTVTLLKGWSVTSVQIDFGRSVSVLLFLTWAQWNDLITPSFSAYVMSAGKQQDKGEDKAETKQSQKVKNRVKNFGRIRRLSPIIDIDMKRQKCERGMREHAHNL